MSRSALSPLFRTEARAHPRDLPTGWSYSMAVASISFQWSPRPTSRHITGQVGILLTALCLASTRQPAPKETRPYIRCHRICLCQGRIAIPSGSSPRAKGNLDVPCARLGFLVARADLFGRHVPISFKSPTTGGGIHPLGAPWPSEDRPLCASELMTLPFRREGKLGWFLGRGEKSIQAKTASLKERWAPSGSTSGPSSPDNAQTIGAPRIYNLEGENIF